MEANGTRPEPVVLQRERIGEPRKTAEKLCENCTFHKQLESCLYCMKDQPLSDVEPKDLVFTEENDDKQRTFSNPHDRICFPPIPFCKAQDDGDVEDVFISQSSNMNPSTISSGISSSEKPCSNSSHFENQNCFQQYLGHMEKFAIDLSGSRQEPNGM